MRKLLISLGERRIILFEFAKSIRGMEGLRNILVHEYVDLDLKKIYEISQNRLGDFYDLKVAQKRFNLFCAEFNFSISNFLLPHYIPYRLL